MHSQKPNPLLVYTFLYAFLSSRSSKLVCINTQSFCFIFFFRSPPKTGFAATSTCFLVHQLPTRQLQGRSLNPVLKVKNANQESMFGDIVSEQQVVESFGNTKVGGQDFRFSLVSLRNRYCHRRRRRRPHIIPSHPLVVLICLSETRSVLHWIPLSDLM